MDLYFNRENCYIKVMKKYLLAAFFLLWLLFFPSRVEASLLVVKSDGELVLNVLSSESALVLEIPDYGQLGVKKAATEGETSENILLSREDNKISLRIGESKFFDVTDWKEGVMEIEERPESKSIHIDLWENKFRIQSEGVFALTDLPFSVNPSKDKFSVTTPSGEKYVAILPHEAVQTVLRAKVLSQTDKALDLVEEAGVLSYLVKGKKVINLFNFYDLKVAVTAKVSASTGEIYFIEQPPWLRVLGVLFS